MSRLGQPVAPLDTASDQNGGRTRATKRIVEVSRHRRYETLGVGEWLKRHPRGRGRSRFQHEAIVGRVREDRCRQVVGPTRLWLPSLRRNDSPMPIETAISPDLPQTKAYCLGLDQSVL